VSREPRLLLQDIRECCQKILRYVEGVSDSDALLADELTFDAVIRNLEVIGEATKQMPESVKRGIEGVEWRRIASFRDVAIHAYPTIEVEIVWDIIQSKVPDLLSSVETAIRNMEAESP
jgi:uncharacterized protein with HEPN domain